MSSGTEVPENPTGGGARARSSVQALPSQHPLLVHGAGLPGCGRGQLHKDSFWSLFLHMLQSLPSVMHRLLVSRRNVFLNDVISQFIIIFFL